MTKAKPLPNQETLKRLLDYDPHTGVLTWKARTPDDFEVAFPERAAAAFNGKLAGKVAFTASTGGYLFGRVLGQRVYAHRIAFKIMTGVDPIEVDHKNRNKLDNRWKNLRSATRSENEINKGLPRTNTSGSKGVTWCSRDRRWKAQIGRNGKTIYLGSFTVKQDAESARLLADATMDARGKRGNVNR